MSVFSQLNNRVFGKSSCKIPDTKIKHSWDKITEISASNTYILFSNILDDVLSATIGIDPLIIDSLYTDTTSQITTVGLVDLIVTQWLCGGSKSYEVSVQEGVLFYKNVLTTNKNNPNILKIDFKKNFMPHIVNNMYTAINSVLCNSEININLSNHPSIQLHQLREIQKEKKIDLESEIQVIAKAMNSPTGSVTYLDALDKITLLSLNVANYTELVDLFFKIIATTTRLPRSYIDGSVATGISGSREGDTTDIERAFKGFFNRILKPILDRINVILGITQPIAFRSNLKDKYKGVAGLIQALEGSSLISEDKKIALIDNMLPELENLNNGNSTV